MGRCGAGLIAAVLTLAGCKSTSDPKPSDRESPGTTASRGKAKDGKDAGKGPTWLDPVAKLPGAGTSVPKAGAWSGDGKAESPDGLSGKVVDIFDRPAKNVFIHIAAANDSPGSSAKGLGIYADNNGYFSTRGLKAGTTYNVTAEATQDGKPLTGTVQTRVPNTTLTIVLRDDTGLPPVGGGAPPKADGGSGAFPPPPVPADDRIPPMGFGPGSPGGNPRPGDGAWSPGGATGKPPAAIGGSRPPTPGGAGGGPLPDPDDLTNPGGKPIRPESVAGGPSNPWNPPVAAIPNPNPAPVPTPRLPDPKLPPGLGVPEAKLNRVPPNADFRLVDSLERPWAFGANKSGSVVLVEFVTTVCPNCKPVVPVLKDLQSRYGASGLEVVAVLCDEAGEKERVAAAAKYGKDNDTNYQVMAEPGANPGAVRDRYGVDRYPQAVLLDANGAVLWKGHPGKKAELESAVRKALGK